MNELARPAEGVLHRPDTPVVAHLPPSARPSPLRRRRYFTRPGRPLLTVEQQQALVKLAREGDAAAKRKMMESHLHLLVDFARHYANSGPAPLDLIREGNNALIRALEEFDPEGSLSFTAFATSCICQNIERTIAKWDHCPHRRNSISKITQRAAPLQIPAVLRCQALGVSAG